MISSQLRIQLHYAREQLDGFCLQEIESFCCQCHPLPRHAPSADFRFQMDTGIRMVEWRCWLQRLNIAGNPAISRRNNHVFEELPARLE